MCIRCHGNPFTEQLPCDSPGIVDMFTGRYQAKHVPSCDRCIATATHAMICNAVTKKIPFHVDWLTFVLFLSTALQWHIQAYQNCLRWNEWKHSVSWPSFEPMTSRPRSLSLPSEINTIQTKSHTILFEYQNSNDGSLSSQNRKLILFMVHLTTPPVAQNACHPVLA
jgi:hypothetical protein